MFWGLLRKKSFVEIFNEMLPTARNLWGKSLMKYGLWPEIIIGS